MAECDGGQYRFVADGIQQAQNPEYRIYCKENWEPIKREEFGGCAENVSTIPHVTMEQEATPSSLKG